MGRRERGKQEREEYTNRLHWGLGNKREKPQRTGRKGEGNKMEGHWKQRHTKLVEHRASK